MSGGSVAPAASARTRHLVPAALVLALALWIAWSSWTREPAGAFLFPRLIGSVMLALALWNFARAALGLARVGDGLSVTGLRHMLPGVLVMVALVLFAAKALGFYTASLLAFVTLYALYDPAPHGSLRAWVRRVLVAVLFVAIIYCLFTLLLKVQTPRGLFL